MPKARKSLRLPSKMVEEIEQLRGTASFSRVVRSALRVWLKRRRRKAEDEMIKRAFWSRSAEQVAEEDRILRRR